jgi:hypothetical protein
MENLKCGIHKLTIETNRKGEKTIAVSTKTGSDSMVSRYSLDEYERALACFKRLTAESEKPVKVIMV